MNKEEMLDSVRNYISYFGEVDLRIVEAMRVVDRIKFYPFGENAYDDIPQEIAKGQTISQPSCVGRMLNILKLNNGDSVLEVGAGSGWLASLLSYLVNPGKILSLEIHEELLETAKKNSAEFGLDNNLHIENQDFYDLIQSFDKIIFSCGISAEEEFQITNWVRGHLKEGGIAVIPFSKGPLIIFSKEDSKMKKSYTEEEYCFASLLS